MPFPKRSMRKSRSAEMYKYDNNRSKVADKAGLFLNMKNIDSLVDKWKENHFLHF